ncbi:phytanoyl-CoA dioxygenase family protein, partial [Sphingomonas sp. 28-62-11]|uniref:phytanoyl-CoA dioxygenase family protein n=1 Tax=Sphingomonas sp. 28-62-11 TaxID=1970432 RepID=UPI0035A82D0C
KLNLGVGSFPTFTPYIEHDVIKNMFCSVEMNIVINDLIGEQLGLHFNLSPFVSTERGWHQDEYLNPPGTNGRYLAVWIAVDDIPEESGPFEFIRGSHKYLPVSRDKVMPYLKEEFQAGTENLQDWSVHSSMFINPAYFYKFCLEQKKVTKFLGKKGDVLLWHSRLIHRGSPPTSDAQRPGIIGHFSPIRTARWFGGGVRRNGNGGYYWYDDEWTEASRSRQKGASGLV